MSGEKKTSSLTRRDFVKGVVVGGVAVAAVGGVGAVVGPSLFPQVTEPVEAPEQVALSKGVLVVDRDICGLCRTCEAVCTLTNDGVGSPELARIQVVKNFQEFDVEPSPCLQCVEPKCLRACPVAALSVDTAAGTNARVIDEETCVGCYRCIDACPFDPPRTRFDTEEKVAVKCNLCGGDPQCVKYCPSGALKYYTNTEGVRSGYEG